MKNLHPLVKQIISSWPIELSNNPTVTVGISGGIDSVALLHILHHIKQYKLISLSAVHINHGISPNASKWACFCQQLCNQLNIPLSIECHSLARGGGESLENVARKARYASFFKQDSQVIALAHHQSDQVETTFSQLLRGSDLHNIAAMRTLNTKNNKIIWRPLLTITRAQLEDYANSNSLNYIIDESNNDTQYLRNFIRHKIFPLLQDWDPNVITKMLNFNQQLQDTLTIIDEIAAIDLKTCQITNRSIDLEKLRQLSGGRQKNLLALFIKKQQLPLPSHRQLLEFINQALISKWDKMPQLKLDAQHKITKYKQKIFIDRLENENTKCN